MSNFETFTNHKQTSDEPTTNRPNFGLSDQDEQFKQNVLEKLKPNENESFKPIKDDPFADYRTADGKNGIKDLLNRLSPDTTNDNLPNLVIEN